MLCVGIILIASPLKAQKTEISINQIPQAVVKAIQTDFPAWDINKTKWYAYDQDTGDWAPIIEDKNINRYVVEAKGDNYKVQAVYDKTGKLRYSKTTISDSALPKAILDKLATDEYKGWNLVGTQEVIRNFKEDKKTFKVYLQQDSKKKTEYFDRMGNKVKRFGLTSKL